MPAEFDNTKRLLEFVTSQRIKASLQAAALWLGAATDAAKVQGVGFRDIEYFADGSFRWKFPHSNAGEQINTWLWLHEYFGEDEYLQRALHYADTLIEDPVHGIYRGQCKEAHGLPWYWRESGVYTGTYGMRLPAAFAALRHKTGKAIYEEYLYLTGDVLIERQTDVGLIDAGWSRPDGFAAGGQKVNSRIGYCMGTFACLYRESGDQRYLDALEKMIVCFERMQNDVGSFFHNYDTRTAEPLDSSVKNHFFGYLLNGLMDAYEIVPDERLLFIAQRLADFVVKIFYYRKNVPYCWRGEYSDELASADAMQADAPIIDPANGLFKLYRHIQRPEYFNVALNLWFEYSLHQADCPARSELHGATVWGMNPATRIRGVLNGEQSTPVAHNCVYYHNQFILSSRLLWGIISKK